MEDLTQRYSTLRRHLDELGYCQTLPVDAINLVEKLVADLIQTTESLRHYKEIAASVSELGCEPYKCDNTKLVQEVNDLNLQLLHQQDQAECVQLELRRKIRCFETQRIELESDNRTLQAKVRELELVVAEKTGEIYRLQGLHKLSGRKSNGSKCTTKRSATSATTVTDSGVLLSAQTHSSEQLSSMMDRCECLSREVRLLTETQKEQSEIIDSYKKQVEARNNEINRLNSLLRGGRPLSAMENDCCYPEKMKMATELNCLKDSNKLLEEQLKESVHKQHEAMTRCLNLADRNRVLEKELQDMDNMALAVERQCNNTVQMKEETVADLQKRLSAAQSKLTSMEMEMISLKRSNQEISCDLEQARKDHKNTQIRLEQSIKEKKTLIENADTNMRIEHDLNAEIERLTQNNMTLKQRVSELESRLINAMPIDLRAYDKKISRKKTRLQSRSPSPNQKPNALSLGSSPVKQNPQTVKKGGDKRNDPYARPPFSSDCNDGIHGLIAKEHDHCDCHMRDMSKQAEHCVMYHTQQSMDKELSPFLNRLQSERDFYYKEYVKLRDRLINLAEQPSRPMTQTSQHNYDDENYELRRRLNEKEQLLSSARLENKEIQREKQRIASRLENSSLNSLKDCDYGGHSVKAMVNRLERERDLARGDVERLEIERDSLRERLRIATEVQVTEHTRLHKAFQENEDRIRQLEIERRELMTNQGSRRAALNNLEEQCAALKEQLQMNQKELSHHRTMYSQLKILQEQTDRALSDCQGQLSQSEGELRHAKERVRDLEELRHGMEQETGDLKADLVAVRAALSEITHEKEAMLLELDTKTERIAKLESDLRIKDNKLMHAESQCVDLKKKLDLALEENAGREHSLFQITNELEALRQEIKAVLRTKEHLTIENSRLQDDLASATLDLRNTRREWESARQEAENLKIQLQGYVSEVQRAEDLISRKEAERSEMLEHFRSLSHEATVLETNNHSLESEAADSKMQLHCANDRIIDLQQQCETKDAMIRGCEAQIADLTKHIASLESELARHVDKLKHTESELASVRELCAQIDGQKDSLMHESGEISAVRSHIENELSRVRVESDSLKSTLQREKSTIDSLQNMLMASRQEAVDQRLLSQEMGAEVQRLRHRVDELQTKLEQEADQVRRYQTQAQEYHIQVQELRREMTNERFNSARANEEKRSAAYHPYPPSNIGILSTSRVSGVPVTNSMSNYIASSSILTSAYANKCPRNKEAAPSLRTVKPLNPSYMPPDLRTPPLLLASRTNANDLYGRTPTATRKTKDETITLNLTSTGPPISQCKATYTVVRMGKNTATNTTNTRVNVTSGLNSTRPILVASQASKETEKTSAYVTPKEKAPTTRTIRQEAQTLSTSCDTSVPGTLTDSHVQALKEPNSTPSIEEIPLRDCIDNDIPKHKSKTKSLKSIHSKNHGIDTQPTIICISQSHSSVIQRSSKDSTVTVSEIDLPISNECVAEEMGSFYNTNSQQHSNYTSPDHK